MILNAELKVTMVNSGMVLGEKIKKTSNQSGGEERRGRREVGKGEQGLAFSSFSWGWQKAEGKGAE